MGWPANRCGEHVRLREPCRGTITPAPPMPTPAHDLAQLLAPVLAYRPPAPGLAAPRSAYLLLELLS
jgi:hypothetical protein